MRIHLLLSSFFMITACAEEETKKVKEDFVLWEGEWRIGAPTMDDGCGYDFELPESGPKVSLTMNNDGTGFSVLLLAEDDESSLEPPPFPCELDGLSYSCYRLKIDKEDYSRDGLDAVVKYWVSGGGEFTSDTEGTWTATHEITCHGADCGDVEFGNFAEPPELPCTTILTSPMFAL